MGFWFLADFMVIVLSDTSSTSATALFSTSTADAASDCGWYY